MTGIQSLYFGVSDGYSYKVNSSVYSDDGTAISYKLRLKYDTGDGKRTTMKSFNSVITFGELPRGARILYSVIKTDRKTDYDSIKEAKDSTERFDIVDKGTACSIGIDESSTNKVELEGYEIDYTVLPEKI